MSQERQRVDRAVSAAAKGNQGRNGTAQHLASLLFGRGWNREMVHDWVAGAVRSGEVRKDCRKFKAADQGGGS